MLGVFILVIFHPIRVEALMTLTMNIEILNEKEIYRTADLALATAISLFYPIERIEKENPRKAQFLFKRNKQLDSLIESYWRGELKVEPQAYFNQLRIIKARLYGGE
jgi:hypothetical protein